MRFAKIKPGVISVLCRNKRLTDKDAVIPFNRWGDGDADELIKRGFIVEVNQDGSEIGTKDTPGGDDDTPGDGDADELIKDVLGKKNKKKK